jgi:hypothetical protein
MKGLLLSLVMVLNCGFVRAATVAHYKFEATPNAPLYELTDSSGRGHHGRVLGEEPFEVTTDVPPFPAITTTALDLRGRLDYAVIPHHSDFAPTGAWTIEFFIKPVLFHQDHGGATNVGGPFATHINTNVAYTVLYKQNTNEVTKYGSAWAFHYLPDKGWLVFTISYGQDLGETMLFAKDLRDDKWHHVAVVFDTAIENEIRVFLDGFKFGSVNQHGGNIPISWGTGPIYIGAFSRQNEFFALTDRNFDGMIDELRFSDAALDTSSFVVDFTPFLSPPIPVEIYSAVEIEFQADAGQIYRLEQQTSAGAWQTLGYLFGEGAPKSFFHRRDQTSPQIYRVLRDDSSASEITFTQHDGVEIRFPTDHGQLYTIQHGETMPVDFVDQVFILGDGAKYSHFQRALTAARFYKVERY